MMKTASQLSNAQVTTPKAVVDLFWRLTGERRDTLRSVLDLGAGDGRFAVEGNFQSYLGIEIDRKRLKSARLPSNAKIVHGCAFRQSFAGFDACIGNPPYARHHDIEARWKRRTLDSLSEALGVDLDRRSNLYLYFMGLALLRTDPAGLVALVVPHEWIARPSSRPLRDYISSQGWSVDVYRFTRPIFEGVLTTASITVIDKSIASGKWKQFDVLPDLINVRPGNSRKSASRIITYENRGSIWAERGLSPGSQKVFTLTEGQRLHNGLTLKDVIPCVTSLATLPKTVRSLTPASFKRHYIDTGEKCWLIKSFSQRLSNRLIAYLDSIKEIDRSNWTCTSRSTWYRFRLPRVPGLLVSSGFVHFGPKALVNSIGAIAVGTVYGVHGAGKQRMTAIRKYLVSTCFEDRVIPHAKTLKKLEVRQLNSVLNSFLNGRY